MREERVEISLLLEQVARFTEFTARLRLLLRSLVGTRLAGGCGALRSSTRGGWDDVDGDLDGGGGRGGRGGGEGGGGGRRGEARAGAGVVGEGRAGGLANHK